MSIAFLTGKIYFKENMKTKKVFTVSKNGEDKLN